MNAHHVSCDGSKMVRVYVQVEASIDESRAFYCYVSPKRFLEELKDIVDAIHPEEIRATYGDDSWHYLRAPYLWRDSRRAS